MEVQFVLNKKQVKVDVGPDAVLLNVLRDLGCKSVKCGCETTNCGLCTVWIDGKSRLSCSILAVSVGGHEITTLEGVEKEAAVRELEDPDIEEIKEYLAGNLCRCTGYMGQLRAIEKYLASRKEAQV